MLQVPAAGAGHISEDQRVEPGLGPRRTWCVIQTSSDQCSRNLNDLHDDMKIWRKMKYRANIDGIWLICWEMLGNVGKCWEMLGNVGKLKASQPTFENVAVRCCQHVPSCGLGCSDYGALQTENASTAEVTESQTFGICAACLSSHHITSRDDKAHV